MAPGPNGSPPGVPAVLNLCRGRLIGTDPQEAMLPRILPAATWSIGQSAAAKSEMRSQAKQSCAWRRRGLANPQPPHL